MALEEVKTLNAETVYRITSETDPAKRRDNDLAEIGGYYLGNKSVENELNPAKPSTIHYFLADGKVVGAWGNGHMNMLLSSIPSGNGKAMFVVIKFDGLKAAARKGMQPSRQYKLFRDAQNIIDVAVAATANMAIDVDSESEDFSDLTSSSVASQAASSGSSHTPTKERAARVTSLLNNK
jgi:hypothetical protein